MEAVIEENKKKSWTRYLRKPGKHMFWTWIAYQSIKGTLTTSLIWIPLLWTWIY